ncbi:hydrogenase nickel incorporation protein HypB [Enorma phocaeensis]|uniref:Hydrogenase nickel incorporation protein HypB n=1 Tax=Enorma phocaeensis TaxID=1871019 RepID=A0A921IRQ7_9ACTN|nr:hydrogenase nickel incorporation protein HypB [Enorma phocaeensis]HJG36552.1 hydrogenase nickel incorporation protein HypB [Enorma phocaeensis]
MSERVIDLEKPILSRNDRLAAQLRERFRDTGTFVVNVLSSPGSGKSSMILATSARLRDAYGLRSAVIEGDIASDVDAQRMKAAGMPAIQINTGGLCHLEGNMIGQAVEALDGAVGLSKIDVIFIENVGNLVCPVDFDLGENLCVMILSVPEGDDKPLKYPGIFQHAGALLLNKVDVAPAFDFNREGYNRVLDDLNPAAPRFEVSATKGDGMDAWVSWLAEQVRGARASTA